MNRSLFIGHKSKQLGVAYPKHVLLRDRRPEDVLIRRHLFRSLALAIHSLRKALQPSGSKVLVVARDEFFTEILEQCQREFQGRFYFINYKWVAGLFTNSTVTRNNVERFFVEGSDYSTRSRRKTCMKMYRGLQGLVGRPNLIIGLGGTELDIMLRELQLMRHPIEHIVTRDTDTKMVPQVSNPILVNDDDMINLYMIMRCLKNEIHHL